MILIKKWEKECNSFHWGKVDNQGISKKIWLPDERLREASRSRTCWFDILNLQQLGFCCYFIKRFNFPNRSTVPFPV